MLTSVLAFRLKPAHTNLHNLAHGGLLATLVDCSLGYYIPLRCNTPVVTVSMSIDYLNAVKIGDWVEASVTIDKQGRRLIYGTCILKVGDLAIAKASAIFAARKAE